MTTETQLTLRPEPQEPSVGMLLAEILRGGISTDNMAVVERMISLKERTDQRQAEKDFAAAFADLQADTPSIVATGTIKGKDGSVRSSFAPYERIMEQVQPLLKRHGFTVSFDSEIADGRVKVTCKILHRGGHSQSNSFAVRIGQGPPGASEAQSDGAANTYAKRGALCQALNIVIDHDTDARAEGSPITQQQADELRELCELVKADRAKFLKLAEADTFEEIKSVDLAMLTETLERRRTKA